MHASLLLRVSPERSPALLRLRATEINCYTSLAHAQQLCPRQLLTPTRQLKARTIHRAQSWQRHSSPHSAGCRPWCSSQTLVRWHGSVLNTTDCKSNTLSCEQIMAGDVVRATHHTHNAKPCHTVPIRVPRPDNTAHMQRHAMPCTLWVNVGIPWGRVECYKQLVTRGAPMHAEE